MTEDADGHATVTGVYVHGVDVSASMLQSVPVTQLRTALDLGIDTYTLKTVLKYSGSGVPLLEDQGGRRQVATIEAQAQDAPPELQLIEPVSRPPLTRPDGRDPESFYRQVADAYRDLAPRTRAPAVTIAEETGVPVRTVHGWIHEARRRGFLPPGRKAR